LLQTREELATLVERLWETLTDLNTVRSMQTGALHASTYVITEIIY